ncbi:MAG TPA: hypothetical protein VM597_30415, partial [Gemmataceae bacterium]|nr:hypothetical protein [Gemmataceae bacterium]
VYTVHRLNWRVHEGRWYRLPGSTPVRSFADRESATALARDQDWGYRRALNPFRCGGPRLQYQTHFDAPRLFDWLLDHELDPPAVTADSAAWAAWWDAQTIHFSVRQQSAVWEALDRVRFAAVREEAPGRTLHLVGRPMLEVDPLGDGRGDEEASYVGTRPRMMCGRPASADALCGELFRTEMARHGLHFDQATMTGGWERSGGRRPVFAWYHELQSDHPTDNYERLPCPFHGAQPWPGQTLYLVLRRPWVLAAGDAWRFHPIRGESSGRPVAAYDTLAAADDVQAELESAARAEIPSPFRFGSVLEWTTLHPSAVWGVLSNMRPITFTGLWSDYWATDRLWSEWWDQTAPGLSPEQIESTWDLFDKLRFYEVVEVEYRD